MDCVEIDLRALSPKLEQPFEPLDEPGVGLGWAAGVDPGAPQMPLAASLQRLCELLGALTSRRS